MTYWEQRSADSIGRMEKAVNGQIPDLVKSFETARNDLNDQIERFFARYAQNNKISLADARQQLSLSELKDFKGDLEEYTHLAKGSIGTFNQLVDNLLAKARITRLEALQMQCDAVLQKLYQEQRARIIAVASGVFNEEYNRRLFDIEQYTGFMFKSPSFSDALIENVIAQPVYGMDVSEHLWRQDVDTGFRIRQTLNNMFMTGKPPQYFAEQLSKVIGAVQVDGKDNATGTGKKFEAYRLLYNESTHSVNQAQLQAYRDDGIEQYEVMETLDRKTCNECQAMDGKHFQVDKAVEGENHPSFHVFCRGTTAPYIPDLANLTGTRVARDPVSGKNIPSTADNYNDWIEQQTINCGKVGADKQCMIVQNENNDFALYQKYKGTLKNESPQSFADFQNLKYNNAESWKLLKLKYRSDLLTQRKEEVVNAYEEYGAKSGFLVVKKPNEVPDWLLQQHLKWSDNQVQTLEGYTQDKYALYNTILRLGIPDYPYTDEIAAISSAIETSSIEENISVWRGTSFESFANEKEVRNLIDKNKNLILNDEAFCSTSVMNDACLDNDIYMNILIPKGAKGAYVEPITQSKKEYEIILQKNSEFLLLRSDKVDDIHFIQVTLMGEDN